MSSLLLRQDARLAALEAKLGMQTQPPEQHDISTPQRQAVDNAQALQETPMFAPTHPAALEPGAPPPSEDRWHSGEGDPWDPRGVVQRRDGKGGGHTKNLLKDFEKSQGAQDATASASAIPPESAQPEPGAAERSTPPDPNAAMAAAMAAAMGQVF